MCACVCIVYVYLNIWISHTNERFTQCVNCEFTYNITSLTFALTSSLKSRVTRIRAPMPRVCIQVTTFYAEYRHFCNRINDIVM